MKDRDNKIQLGITKLENQLTHLKKNRVTYLPNTNLTLITNHIDGNATYNLRSHTEHELYQIFNKFILAPVQAKKFLTSSSSIDMDMLIYGTSYKYWLQDFQYLISEAKYNEEINAINFKINKLKKFYSEDKLIDDEIEKLLK